MRILTLGNSETRGSVNAPDSWATLAVRELEARIGRPVEHEQRPFVPVGRRAPAYALDLVDRFEPDVVLIPLSEYAFWAANIGLQVEHLLGKRASAVFRRAERGVNRAAAGTAALSYGRDRTRSLARRLIGTRALATPQEAESTYAEVFRGLARRESLEVVIVAYPGSPLPVMSKPRIRAARAEFLGALRRQAAGHRFGWIDGDALALTSGLTPSVAYHADGIHISEAMQPLIGAAVAEQLRLAPTARRIEPSAPATAP